MAGAFSSSLILIVQTLGNLLVMAVLLRLILQIVQADFYNPISQAIVKITNPLLKPIRKITPSAGKFDIASLVLALLLQIMLFYVVLALQKFSMFSMPFLHLLYFSVKEIMLHVLNIYIFSFVVIAIASWIAPQSYHPGLTLLNQIASPLADRVRKFVPPLGGLDFSFMVLMLLIIVLKNFIRAL